MAGEAISDVNERMEGGIIKGAMVVEGGILEGSGIKSRSWWGRNVENGFCYEWHELLKERD